MTNRDKIRERIAKLIDAAGLYDTGISPRELADQILSDPDIKAVLDILDKAEGDLSRICIKAVDQTTPAIFTLELSDAYDKGWKEVPIHPLTEDSLSVCQDSGLVEVAKLVVSKFQDWVKVEKEVNR